MKIIKITDKNNDYFPVICEWQVNWWGNEFKREKVVEWMLRCLNEEEIPQTYIAVVDNKVVGMYQIAMDDDIDIRPDYYPWLVNVYVDKNYRGQGMCNVLMTHAKDTFKELGIKRMYLHTKHIGLYEKYGWQFLEEVETLRGKVKKVYYLDIDY